MCKYCKNLKRIKDLDENYYQEIIKAWQLHSRKAEIIIEELFLLLEYKNVNHGAAYERLHQKACKWLGKNYIE